VYLIDTNIISEARRRSRANPGVMAFFRDTQAASVPLYLSSITVGELQRGVTLIRRRGELAQADVLAAWLATVLTEFGDRVLPFDTEAAQIWGALRVPDPEPALDKQIAAVALAHDLTMVTRNAGDFGGLGLRVLNPFSPGDR
jgi:predicted nucleic acid-binding protein